MPEELWDFMIGNHLRSAFLCIKYAAPHMIAQGWGRIINTSSIHGRVGGRPSLGHYGAAKAGVVALTMTAARELGPKGITANVIAPGFIGTETLRGILAPPTLEKLQQQIPLGRIGEPVEVGRVVAFLASEAASYLNGAVLDISGDAWNISSSRLLKNYFRGIFIDPSVPPEPNYAMARRAAVEAADRRSGHDSPLSCASVPIADFGASTYPFREFFSNLLGQAVGLGRVRSPRWTSTDRLMGR